MPSRNAYPRSDRPRSYRATWNADRGRPDPATDCSVIQTSDYLALAYAVVSRAARDRALKRLAPLWFRWAELAASRANHATSTHSAILPDWRT